MPIGIRETGRLAVSSLMANPLRTLLTSLGIIIGVLAVVGMSSLIEGLNRYVTAELSQVGSDTFYIQARPSVEIRVGGHTNQRDWEELTLEDKRALEEHSPSILFISAYSTHFGAEIRHRGEKTNPNVMLYGADQYLPRLQGLDLESGRFLAPIDDTNRRNVVIIGADIVEKLFTNIDPLGREIRIDSHRYRVIGILERQGEFLGFSQDNLVIIPISSFRKYWGRRSELALSVKALPGRMQEAIDETIAVLRQRREVPPGEPNNFGVMTADAIQQTLNSLIFGISLVMVGIASISLLVGGIGIMNIMLVSVTERTREIGIRKATGARRGDITTQFLVEAVVLSGIGGTVGTLLGVGLGLLTGAVTPLPAAVPFWALLAALLVCGGIGIGFGVYPAMKAARLDPVEALRYE